MRFSRQLARLYEGAIVIVGASIAFAIGYYSLAETHLRHGWGQYLMSAPVNYACTGHFGPIRLPPDASLEERTALAKLDGLFLLPNELDYFCDSIPKNIIATSIWQGLDVANVQEPYYLMLLYGVLWRCFGLHWGITYVVIAATVVASFLVLYACARRFMPAALAAGLILLFLSSPFFVTHLWSPRDAVKFPFAIAIAGLLIGGIASPRKPSRFFGFCCLVGGVIGVGYGFRSDLLYFLLPATAIIFFLGRIDFSRLGSSGLGRRLSGLGVRSLGVGALIASFALGGSMPLVNDLYFHPHSGDMGYHPMAMGLLGVTNVDLYQYNNNTGSYMFRNGFNNDLSVGVRVIEYAERHEDASIIYDSGAYYSFAKKYYLDVVAEIPADLASGAIGAFVNLMTIPRSLGERQALAPQYDHISPWTGPTVFPLVKGELFSVIANRLDAAFANARTWRITPIFYCNIAATFLLLCQIAMKFGARSMIAAMLLLGSILAVTSLKFEQRHMVYIYAFPLVAWGAVVSLAWQSLLLTVRAICKLMQGVGIGAIGLATRVGSYRFLRAAMAVSLVAVILVGLSAATLFMAREYQAAVLQALISDWARRSRVPATTAVSEIASGTSRITILSAIPLSTGGRRPPDSPIIEAVEMGVVAVEFDGKKCAQQPVTVTAVGESNLNAASTFKINETFSATIDRNFVAFFPVFYYLFYDRKRENTATMYFSGIDIPTPDIDCIKEVSMIDDFKKNDVLFDFFVPKDPNTMSKKQLYQRVLIPGLGYK